MAFPNLSRALVLGGREYDPTKVGLQPPDKLVSALAQPTQPQPRPMIAQAPPRSDMLAKALLQGAHGGGDIETPLELAGRLAQSWAGNYSEERRLREEEEKRQAQLAAEQDRLRQLAESVAAGGYSPEALIATGDPDLMRMGLEAKLRPENTAKPTPYTDLGKIATDVRNGILTEEQGIQEAMKLTMGGGGFQRMSPEEVQTWGLDPNRAWGKDKEGKPVAVDDAPDAPIATDKPIWDGERWIQPPQAEGGGLFSGTSVEAQALNYLVNNRVLTPQQAAELATAKQITDPATGAIFLVLPSGVFRQDGPGQPAIPVDPAASPSALTVPQGATAPTPTAPPLPAAPAPQSEGPLAVPPPREGMVPITQPSPGANLTPAEKAVDTAYAKDYADWVAAGGYADVEKQLAQLEEAAASLESKDNLTGPIIGLTPDIVSSFVNPDAIATREAVEEVVQRNLRLILGAQFTEKEGERLIARAYNPRLDEAENAKRVRRLIKQIRAAADAKNAAAEYFGQFGTLKGWNGRLPTIGDFNPDTDDPENDPLGLR